MSDFNDPRLSAYVLGELSDAEAAEVKNAIDASPELKKTVDELRKTADVLSGVLQSEPFSALTDEQRASVLGTKPTSEPPAAKTPPVIVGKETLTAARPGWTALRWVAIAASLLLLAGVPVVIFGVVPRMRDLGVAMSLDSAPQSVRMYDDRTQSAPLPDVSAMDESRSMGNSSREMRKSMERHGMGSGGLAPSDPAAAPAGSSQFSDLPPMRSNNFDAPSELEEAQLSSERDGRSTSPPRKYDNKNQESQRRDEAATPIRNSLGDGKTGGLGGGGDAFDSGSESSGVQTRPGSGQPSARKPVNEVLNGVASDGDAAEAPGRADPASKFQIERERYRKEQGGQKQPGGGRRGVGNESGEGGAAGGGRDFGGQGPDGQPEEESGGKDLLKAKGEGEAKKPTRDDRKKTWKRAAATPNSSRLKVGDRDELPLKGLQANVYIDGFRARVVLDYYYYNDRNNQLEGSFQLRLPNEASLYYFAFGQTTYQYRPMVDQLASGAFLTGDLVRAANGLGPRDIITARKDTWGSVKEARIVQREKAALAYSEVVRKRVDPALVEWSGAGVFNAKVFPLMPRKLHRIVVGYDMNLRSAGEDLQYLLDLPEQIPEAMVDVSVAAIPGSEAIVKPAARPFLSGGRAYYHYQNPKSGSVEVRMKNTGNVTLIGSDEQTGDFFGARVSPPLPSGDLQSGSRRAVFLLDTSLSSNPDKFNVWLKLLEETLKQNRDSMEEFAVLQFNIETHWWKQQFVANNDANVKELLSHCQNLALEGATDLERAVSEAIRPSWMDSDEAANADMFLLSDGAATWGETEHASLIHLVQGDVGALFAYNTGMTETSVGTLQALARETGGALFSVASEGELKKAATAHRRRPWRLIDVQLEGCDDLLIAGRPGMLYPGQELLVVGRGRPADNAQLQFRVKRGGKVRTIGVPLHESLETATAVRLYGQVAVGQFEGIPHGAEDLATAYARHFRVTGRSCSLLMLESEADYRRFNIQPEDDAFVVSSGSADVAILQRIDEIGDKLSSAKASMRAWLEKLRTLQGVNFQISTALRVALDKLPEESFHVKRPVLICADMTTKDLPKSYFKQLSAKQLNYDAIDNEAKRRLQQYGPADSLRAMSCLIERQPGDIVLARDVAFTAMQWGLPGEAYPLLKRVARSRPHEPQIYQAIGHCLTEMGNADLAMVYFEIAHGGNWNRRYKDVKQIAGVEYLDMLRRVETGELDTGALAFAKARLNRLSKELSVKRSDLVVTMMWNTDRTDVDLHIVEPSGEECYYKHRNTKTGGRISGDVTEGFGPEMYAIDKADQGVYKVLANYYGTDANRTQVRTKVYVNIYENFGDVKRQKVTRKTVTLKRGKQKIELARVLVEK